MKQSLSAKQLDTRNIATIMFRTEQNRTEQNRTEQNRINIFSNYGTKAARSILNKNRACSL